jgi:hypothetical protein
VAERQTRESGTRSSGRPACRIHPHRTVHRSRPAECSRPCG